MQRGDGHGGLWRSRTYHQGNGIASFLGKMTKKFIPLAGKFAKKSIKAIKNSDTLKKVGKTLLDSGVEALTDVAASTLDPANKNSVAENTQLRLDQARKDIATILRSKRKRETTGSDSESDSNSSLDDIPVVKRGKRPTKIKNQKDQNTIY